MTQRTIKFRAWDTEEKGWLNKGSNFYLSSDGKNMDEYSDGTIIVMQYTGLKDKQGKEICEGDIVRDEGVIGEDKNVIIPELPRLFHLYGEHVFVPETVEIIGNIWENPELLAPQEAIKR